MSHRESWTFSDEIREPVAEALIHALADAEDPGGFVTGFMIGVIGYDPEGDPSYRLIVGGEARLLEMIGLAEQLKAAVATEYEGGLLAGRECDE